MGIEQIHYNMDEIDKKNAVYNLIYGEKSNGKSYQVKHKKAVEKYFKTGRRFILMRRWGDDLSKGWDIEKITDGKYTIIIPYRHELYAGFIDKSMREIRGEKIGYAIALSLEQRFSGSSFLDVDDIIFEEFMSRRELCTKRTR